MAPSESKLSAASVRLRQRFFNILSGIPIDRSSDAERENLSGDEPDVLHIDEIADSIFGSRVPGFDTINVRLTRDKGLRFEVPEGGVLFVVIAVDLISFTELERIADKHFDVGTGLDIEHADTGMLVQVRASREVDRFAPACQVAAQG